MLEDKDKTRVQLLEELEATRERVVMLEVLFESIPDLAMLLDADLKIRFSNRAAKGLSRSELIGIPLHSLANPEHKVRERLRDALASGAPTRYCTSYKQPDGSTASFESVATRSLVDGRASSVVVLSMDITERTRAERALRESEARHRAMFEEAPLGIALIDSLTGHIYEVNPRFAEIAGRSREEMATIDWMSITHPEDVQEDLDNMALLNAGKISGFAMCKRYLRPDGSETWIDMTIAPVAVEDESKPRHLCMIDDITERKRAEEALQQRTHDLAKRVKELDCLYSVSRLVERPGFSQEEFFQGTVDQIPPSWQYPEITCARMTVDGEHYISANFRETPWRQRSELAVAGQHVGSLEVFYMEARPDAHEGPFSREERSLLEALAERVGRVIERKRLERDLALNTETLSLAQEIAKVGSWSLDLRDNHLSWSDEVYRIFGFEPQRFEATYEAFLDSVHPGDRDVVRASFAKSIETNSPYEIEHRVLRPGGEVRIVREKSINFVGESGEVIRSVGMVHDVTKLKQVEKALRQAKRAADVANQAKSTFLASMSHEIRTPLTAILGCVDILNQPDRDAALFPQLPEMIRRNADHLLSLIDNVLDLSKIEAGELEPSLEPCDVADLLNRIVETENPGAARKGLSLRAVVEGPFPKSVVTDALRLRQIVINLVGNALKFTEVGGVTLRARVELGERPNSRTLKVTVEDTGVGIPPEQMEVIFKPFGQVDASTTRRYGGVGLGLAISRRLAHLLGGEITAESQAGRGTTIMLRLPLCQRSEDDAGELAAAGESALFSGPPLDGMRILLVEDFADTQAIIRHFLQVAGAEVCVADNGALGVQEVLKNVETNTPFDVVLIDMMMPVMDGYQATRMLREHGVETPIIALTAHAMSKDAEKCRIAGCDSYVSKPVKPARLVEAIRESYHTSKKRGGAPSDPPRA